MPLRSHGFTFPVSVHNDELFTCPPVIQCIIASAGFEAGCIVGSTFDKIQVNCRDKSPLAIIIGTSFKEENPEKTKLTKTEHVWL